MEKDVEFRSGDDVNIKLPKSDENLDIIIQIAKNLKAKKSSGNQNPLPNKLISTTQDHKKANIPGQDLDTNKSPIKPKETAKQFKGKPWSNKELKILKESYRKKTVAQIIEQGLLPGRTVNSVKSALRRMNVGKHGKHIQVYPLDMDVFHHLIDRMKGKMDMCPKDINQMIVEGYAWKGKKLNENSTRTYTSNLISYLLKNEPLFKIVGIKKYSFERKKPSPKEKQDKRVLQRSSKYSDHLEKRIREMKKREREFTAHKKHKIISDINQKIENKNKPLT